MRVVQMNVEVSEQNSIGDDVKLTVSTQVGGDTGVFTKRVAGVDQEANIQCDGTI